MKRLISLAATSALLLGAVSATTQTAHAATGSAAIRIASGATASYLITADGKPYGAGDNNTGELTGTGARPTLAPMVGLPAGVLATDIAGGYDHSVVLGSDGVPYGSGMSTRGQLTGTTPRTSLAPMAGLPAGVKATAVAAGGDHSLVLGSDGVPYGTGNNPDGQLTGPSGTDKTALTAMTGLPAGVKATAIATSFNNSLVLGANGVAYGAGFNLYGQLAFPNSADQTSLVALGGLPAGVEATAVSAGFQFSLVLGSDGNAYGTGRNANSQLTGFDSRVLLTQMLGMPGSVKAVKISAGGYHSLVIGTDGVPYGVGYNHDGELTGTTGLNKSSLTPLTGLPPNVTAVDVAANEFTSLVLGSDSTVYGTGGNYQTQLTDASVEKKFTLTPFTGQPFALVTPPALSGSARVGTALTTTAGSWRQPPSSYAYQWWRNGVAIAGATSSTYTPSVADFDQQLSATVTVQKAGFVTGTGSTTAARVGPAPALRLLARKKPVVAGRTVVGKTLRIKHLTRSGWSPAATTLSYRWYRGSKPIKAATKSTYKTKPADRGQRIRVRISGQRIAYATGTYLTKKTAKVKG